MKTYRSNNGGLLKTPVAELDRIVNSSGFQALRISVELCYQELDTYELSLRSSDCQSTSVARPVFLPAYGSLRWDLDPVLVVFPIFAVGLYDREIDEVC
jgi:hypothetical protein